MVEEFDKMQLIAIIPRYFTLRLAGNSDVLLIITWKNFFVSTGRQILYKGFVKLKVIHILRRFPRSSVNIIYVKIMTKGFYSPYTIMNVMFILLKNKLYL